MMKIILVAGARPNFMKIAPLMAAFQARPEIAPILVHTGQHYDRAMSDLFFQQLGIPGPDVNLEVGSASHAVQTAEIMRAFEPVVLAEKPDAVLVVGDVNSTIACGLVAVKLGVKLIHVEAGLRSFDRTMPEEKIHMVGNVMIDTLLKNREKAERPVTVEMGTNRLVGSDPVRILEAYREVMAGNGMAARTPPLWDGQAARRIAECIIGG
jgi:UDP-N-acetylglucosamine 2-epimerase (non-hydrolysing)